jgi:hypothetical protein
MPYALRPRPAGLVLQRVGFFFKSEFEMTKESEDRGLADHHFFLRQASLKFGQCDVGLPIPPSLDPTPVGFQNIPFVAAKLLGANAPGPRHRVRNRLTVLMLTPQRSAASS